VNPMSREFPRPGVKLIYEPPEGSHDTRVLVAARAHIVPSAGTGLAMTRTTDASFTSDTQRASRQSRRGRARDGKVRLLFGAHDTERNNAIAFADYLAAH
jgi:hypothetical protein